MNLFSSPRRHLLTATSLVVAFGLSSCMTQDPYTGEQKVSKTTTGIGLGAALGGVLGGIVGNNTGDGNAGRGIAIGAGLGALAGGSIGRYMDQQEAMLRQELRASGVSVTRQGQNIILNMPHDITFDVARDRIKPDFYRTLNSVSIVLRKFDRTAILVNGHTDSDGGTSYNQSLSQRRARSVADHLSNKGVHPSRLIPRGFGESHPIASNRSAAGKAKNRRVEIHIAPRTR